MSPAQAPLAGGTEVAIFGSGFDAETTVMIGTRAATVLRVETSARVVVEVPPGENLESVDVVVRRRGESVALPAAVRYVPAFFPSVDVTTLSASGHGVEVIGKDKGFATSLAMLDLDGDGLSDVVASSRLGKAVVVYGRRDPPGELHLQDLLQSGTPVEGVAVLLFGGTNATIDAAGDLDADGHQDVAVGTSTAITVLRGGERYEGEVLLEDLVASGRGFEILHAQQAPDGRITRVGGGDHDGDGFGDLVVGWWSRSRPSRVSFVPGRRVWPPRTFLADAATIESLEDDDAFGASLAIVADIDGDGSDELLAGAPALGLDGGNGYLFTGPAFRGTGDVSFLYDIEEQGRVRSRAGIGSSPVVAR
ncbi:MAG: IPT/TIG domain-containing protein [Actinobacteria bacterium]|nr:IPT/TIG domain-containing protein [Actinomycetota bacterium]